MVKTTKSAAPVPTNENNVESVKKTTTEKTKKVPTEKKVKTSKVVEPEVVEPTVVVAEDPLLVSDAVVVSCDSTVVDNTASLNDMPCKIADLVVFTIVIYYIMFLFYIILTRCIYF